MLRQVFLILAISQKLKTIHCQKHGVNEYISGVRLILCEICILRVARYEHPWCIYLILSNIISYPWCYFKTAVCGV